MQYFKRIDGKLYKLVYSKYIRKNGKIIYPKKSKYFKFWTLIDKWLTFFRNVE